MQDDMQKIHVALLEYISTGATIQELSMNARVPSSTLSTFHRGGIKSLSYANMVKLVPVLMPGHRVGIVKEIANVG